MTKTNEPQDILQDILNESVAEQSQDGDVSTQTGSVEATEDNSKVWMDVGGTDSVEEAFLALIESNKPQEDVPQEQENEAATVEEQSVSAEISEDVPAQAEEQVVAAVSEEAPQADIPPLQAEAPVVEEEVEAPTGVVSEATSQLTEEDVEALFPLDPADIGKTMEPEAFVQADVESEVVMDPMAVQPTLTDLPPMDMPPADLPPVELHEVTPEPASEQALTDALSETIAESLAEIQAGQTVEQADEALGIVAANDQIPQPPALLPEQPTVMQEQPTVLPEAPGALPEFSDIPPAPLEGFPVQPKSTVPLPHEFMPEAPKVVPVETNQAPSVNEVMNQHHTLPNPIEIGEPKVTPDVGQVQAAALNTEFKDTPPVPQTGAPIAVDMASQDEAKKTNVDPEFQALVQWSNSDVEPSHHGPHDIPNFLSQKREEETGFNFRSIFVAIGISAIVVGTFSFGFQLGSNKTTDKTTIDLTAKDEESIVLDPPLDSKEGNVAGLSSSSKATASILEFSVADLSGVSGKAVPMDIRLEGQNLGSETTLLFRGIPDGIRLSKGDQKDGFWSVRKSDLKKLALHVPEDYRGKFNFEVFAFKDKESGPERRLASVNIESLDSGRRVDSSINITGGEQQQPKGRTLNDAGGNLGTGRIASRNENLSPVEQRNDPKVPPISAQVEASMLQRANRLLKNGDISGARLIFEHVAIQGSKHAAFALARTYDEDFLEQLFIRGMVPQMDTAVKWYKKAASMGHKDAVRRLDQLGFR